MSPRPLDQASGDRKPVTVPQLAEMKRAGEKWDYLVTR